MPLGFMSFIYTMSQLYVKMMDLCYYTADKLIQKNLGVFDNLSILFQYFHFNL